MIYTLHFRLVREQSTDESQIWMSFLACKFILARTEPKFSMAQYSTKKATHFLFEVQKVYLELSHCSAVSILYSG